MHFLSSIWWKLIRFGFRLLYNELAFTYDLVSWIVSLGSWHCWQRTALLHLPDASATGRILELAHGTGTLQVDLQDAGYHVYGYDLSPAMGRIAQSKIRRNGGIPRLTQGKAQRLPFPDNTFSAVLSTFPTDFIIQAETLNEAYRVLKPGGSFIIVLNGVLTGSSWIEHVLEWLFRVTGQRAETGKTFSDYFEGYGFSITEFQETCPRSKAQLVILIK